MEGGVHCAVIAPRLLQDSLGSHIKRLYAKSGIILAILVRRWWLLAACKTEIFHHPCMLSPYLAINYGIAIDGP